MTDKHEREIDRFFDRTLLPLSGHLKKRGVRFLETQIDRDAPTYFVRRSRVEMARADFETGGCAFKESVEADLERLWGGGEASLAALAPETARLAATLKESERQSDEVSNFVYVMY